MSQPSVDSLFPAIAQSFVIILIGYGFGFFSLIAPKEAKSIGTLIGNLFLPALLFKNLAVLNLSTVSWPFLGGMLVAKFTVFLVVVILTMIVTRRVGTAGLFGIFATQSNDFALGLPIVTAVYGPSTGDNDVFDYESYIYLLAIVSLAIINPIGFLLMEYHKQSHGTEKMSWAKVPGILFRTVKGVVLNPIIFMTVLGIVVNVIVYFGVHHGEGKSADNLPDWLVSFLDTLGGAYTACALFNIGLFMVGKIKKVTGTLVLIATLLISAKTIFLPFLGYLSVYYILPVGVYNSTHEDVSTFGFLLGTFPTAPTVFVYATQYSLAMEIVAASLVLCTFLSAPIMYLSARMILVVYASLDVYNQVINDCRRDVSIVTCVCVAFVFGLFLLARRYRSFAHVFVMHLMVAMLIEVIGVDVLEVVTRQRLLYWEFFYFGIFFIGVLSTRTWMASTAFGLLLLITKGPHKADKAWVPLMLISWGIPIIITVLMVGICSASQTAQHKALVDISFLFGEVQFILSLMVLIVCFIIAFTCVIIIAIYTRQLNRRTASEQKQMRTRTAEETDTSDAHVVQTRPKTSLNTAADSLESSRGSYGATPLFVGGKSPSYGTTPPSTSSTSIVHRAVNFDAPTEVKDEAKSEKMPLIQRDISPEPESTEYNINLGNLPSNTSGLWYKDKSGQHLMRFIVLIMFLLFSSSVGILILIWKLSTPSGYKPNGIFIAVNVLDTITNFGQGFFVFVVFGFEKHWFWVSFYKKLRSLFFRVESVQLPPEEDVEASVVIICESFKQDYNEACKADILGDRKFCLKTYANVFTGSDFVDWLVTKGVTKNRDDAVAYGQSLMVGRVITHVIQEHYFHDEGYFYRFCGEN